VFDAATAAVVRAFQRRWRPMRVDGVGDVDTIVLANSVAALAAV
jgi:N-acetyl-anhydromuramyl-L-alanine amidase AmpD